jgi:hypothetical protein
MNRPIHPIEMVAFAAMLAWLVGQLLYTLPFPRLRRRLDRVNAGLWFANWSVFGAGSEHAEIATYTLEYRDRRGVESGDWVEVVRGRPWCWHAFLWQPHRHVADRLHRFAEGIARTVEFDSDGARTALRRRCRLIANHVDAMCPRSPKTRREIRIKMKRAANAARPGVRSGDIMMVQDRVLLAFSVDGNDL